MLRVLTFRERGLENPLHFFRSESTRRAFGLELSSHRDVERIFTGNINTLDLDLVEKRYLLSGGADGHVVIYDTFNTTGKVKYTVPSVGTIAFNNRHRHKFNVETVLWYPLDTGMFTSSGTDKFLKVWDTNRLKPADEYEFSGIVYNHHMSPVATKHCLIAVGYHSSSVVLVDLKSGSSTHTLSRGHSKPVLAVKWSPFNEFLLASGSADGKIILWDIRNAKSSLISFDQHNGRVSRKKDSKKDSKDVTKDITAHSGSVNGIEFTPDGLHLMSVGTDNSVRLWNTSNGKNKKVKFSEIPISTKRKIQFALSTGTSPGFAFIPNGQRIEMLDLQTGARLNTFQGHFSYVNSCLYHPDYHELYSAGSDRNILIWTQKAGPAGEEEEEEGKRKEEEKHARIVQRVAAATADSWSSDEET